MITVKLDLEERRTLIDDVDVSAAVHRDGVRLDVNGTHRHVTLYVVSLRTLDTLAEDIQTAVTGLEQAGRADFDVTGVEPFTAAVEIDWAPSRFTDPAELQAFLDRHPGHYEVRT